MSCFFPSKGFKRADKADLENGCLKTIEISYELHARKRHNQKQLRWTIRKLEWIQALNEQTRWLTLKSIVQILNFRVFWRLAWRYSKQLFSFFKNPYQSLGNKPNSSKQKDIWDWDAKYDALNIWFKPSSCECVFTKQRIKRARSSIVSKNGSWRPSYAFP